MKTQNDANKTPEGVDEKGNEVVKKEEGHQKKIIRKNALYSDGAMEVAKRLRGS